ncbi:MAG: hypothetical protein IPO21_14970 [Bacteroidales bacterium]|nr:hypothetical protein [Bacteroidales bacterium]
MKKTAFLIIILSLFLFNNQIFGQDLQNQKITFKVDSVSLEHALFLLGKRVNAGIQYNSNILNRDRIISVDFKNTALLSILQYCINADNSENTRDSIIVRFSDNQIFLNRIQTQDEITLDYLQTNSPPRIEEQNLKLTEDTLLINSKRMLRTLTDQENSSQNNKNGNMIVFDTIKKSTTVVDTIHLRKTIIITDTIYKTITKNLKAHSIFSVNKFMPFIGVNYQKDEFGNRERSKQYENARLSYKTLSNFNFNFNVGVASKKTRWSTGIGIHINNHNYSYSLIEEGYEKKINRTRFDTIIHTTLTTNDVVLQKTDTVTIYKTDTILSYRADTLEFGSSICATYFKIPLSVEYEHNINKMMSALVGFGFVTNILLNVKGDLLNYDYMKISNAENVYYPIYSTCNVNVGLGYNIHSFSIYVKSSLSYSVNYRFQGANA